MPASRFVNVSMNAVRMSAISSCVRTVKSSGSPAMSLCWRSHQHRDRVGDVRDRIGARRRDRDVLDVLLPLQALLDGGVRREDRVVLVVAHGRLTLRVHDADDLERLIPHADHLSRRIDLGPEELIADRLTQHRDFRRAAHVLRAEEHAVFHVPLTHEREVDVGAFQARRPVLIARNHLRAGVHAGGDVLDVRHFLLDGVDILDLEAGGRAHAAAHAAHGEVAGHDGDEVRAARSNLLLDAYLGAVAERDQRNHGRDADDHAEHGQGCAHLVARERLERDTRGHDRRHRCLRALLIGDGRLPD